jgi:imidazolonepropionase-like amidohydrolase
MKKCILCILVLISLAFTQVFAQHEDFDRNSWVMPNDSIALKAAKLLDVRKGVLLNNSVVLIKNGIISSVGSNLKVPEGYRIIDLGNVTLMPGLIDCHTHLVHEYGVDNIHSFIDETYRKSTAERVLLGTVLAKEMLEAGFTTVRDLGNSGVNGDVALRDAIRAGYVIGPKMFVSTRALAPVGGQARKLSPAGMQMVKEEYVEFDGPEEGKKAVRRAVYDGANCIKIIANNKYNYISTEEIKAVVDEAHRLGYKVAAHATGGKAVRNCIDAGVNSIEHGYDLSDEEIKLMAKKQIFLVPTDATESPYHQERLARAFKGGVPIAAGADIYYKNEKKTRGQRSVQMFKAYVAAGLTPLQAIQAGTINAGELIGFPNRIGSAIEAGKPADIIAVQGDVLKDINVLDNVGFVMRDGKVYFDKYLQKK